MYTVQFYKRFFNTTRRGFLLVEVLLTISLLSLLITSIVGAVIYGQESTRISGTRSQAVALAEEGLEGVRNMRDEQFTNLVDGTYGLTTTGNQWNLAGSSDSTGIFTRQISLSTVTATKKQIISNVTWQQNQQRNGSVSLTSNLTRWLSRRGGLLVYGNASATNLRVYNNVANTFSAASALLPSTSGRSFVIRTSPIKTEAIAGFIDSSNNLQVLCYNGTSWSTEWSVAIGSASQKRFGIAYETTSGDVMVVYSRNVAATNAMAYRTKLGSNGCGSANWPVATNFPTGTSLTTGTVQWVRLEASPVAGSNNLAIAWNDNSSRLGAAFWNGSSWSSLPAAALETSLERAAAAGDAQSFDLAFESVSGNVMVVWGVLTTTTACTAGSNCIRYSRYTGSWSAAAAVPTVADGGTSIDISANPNSNELVMAAIDDGTNSTNAQDLSIAYWSGSVWTGRANVDTTTATPTAGNKLVATGWLINGAQTRYIVIYNDSAATNIGWYVGNGSGAPALQTDCSTPTCTPAFASPQSWYDIQTDPFNKNTLLFTISDNASDLFAKRLTMNSSGTFISPDGWTNADGGAALETTLGQATASPFSFAYWRNP